MLQFKIAFYKQKIVLLVNIWNGLAVWSYPALRLVTQDNTMSLETVQPLMLGTIDVGNQSKCRDY